MADSLADTPQVGLEVWERLLKVRDRVQAEERRDVLRAERAERLAALLRSDVWSKDLVPMLQRMWDDVESQITPQTPDGELRGWTYYKSALQHVVNLIDGSLQLGSGAIRRISERKFGRTLGSQRTA